MGQWKKATALMCASLMLASTAYSLQGQGTVAEAVSSSDSQVLYGKEYTQGQITWKYSVYKTSEGHQYARIEGATGLKEGTDSALSIPSQILNRDTQTVYPVEEIYMYAFKDNTVIQQLTIPSTVQKIGMSAFNGCTKLEKVTIATGETKEKTDLILDGVCFAHCSSLYSVKLRDNIQNLKLNSQAFDGDKKLVVCGTSIDEVKKTSNLNCKVSCGKDTFYNCVSLGSMIFEQDTVLGEKTFFNAFALEEGSHKTLTFMGDLETYSAYKSEGGSFVYCQGLEEIIFQKKVKLCTSSFEGDINLKKITWGTDTELAQETWSNASTMFDSCVNLETFEFLTGNVKFDDYLRALPKNLKTIIYDGEVSGSSWLDAPNVILKGNFSYNNRVSVDSKVTKNIYCYRWDADLSMLDFINGENVNVYGVDMNTTHGKYTIKKVLANQPNCKFHSIIKSWKVKNYNPTLIVNQNQKLTELTLSPKELGIELEASLYSGEEASQTVGIDSNSEDFQLEIAYGALKPGANTIDVKLGTETKQITVNLQYNQMKKLEVAIRKDASNADKQMAVYEGKNQFGKSAIDYCLVTYADGSTEKLTSLDGISIGEHEILVGNGNQVVVTYTNANSGEKISCLVDVYGSVNKVQDELYVEYKYPTENKAVLVNTELDPKKIVVSQCYANGTKVEIPVENCTITGEITKCGDNEITVVDKTTKRKGSLILKGVGIKNLSVSYIGEAKYFGEEILSSDFYIAATDMNGAMIKQGDIQTKDIRLSKIQFTESDNVDGYASVIVAYADKEQTVLVPVRKANVVGCRAELVNKDLVAVAGKTLEAEDVKVYVQYENGGEKLMPASSVAVNKTPLVVGNNTVVIEVCGVQTQVEVRAQRVEIKALYVGENPIYPGQEIPLKDIEVTVTVYDGETTQITKLSTEEYALSSDNVGCVYVSKYGQTIEIDEKNVDASTGEDKNPIESQKPQATPVDYSQEIAAFEAETPTLYVNSKKTKFVLMYEMPSKTVVDSYDLYYSWDGKKYSKLLSVDGDTNSTEWTSAAAMQDGAKVYFKIVANKKIGQTQVHSKGSKKVAKYLLKPLKNVQMGVEKNNLIFRWKKNDDCQGYRITLTLKNAKGKKLTKRFAIKGKNKEKYSLGIDLAIKKFKALKTKQFKIVSYSVQSYYKNGKKTSYSECRKK